MVKLPLSSTEAPDMSKVMSTNSGCNDDPEIRKRYSPETKYPRVLIDAGLTVPRLFQEIEYT